MVPRGEGRNLAGILNVPENQGKIGIEEKSLQQSKNNYKISNGTCLILSSNVVFFTLVNFIENSCIKYLFVFVNFENVFISTSFIIDASQDPPSKTIGKVPQKGNVSFAYIL
jgi:hypothetical protein